MAQVLNPTLGQVANLRNFQQRVTAFFGALRDGRIETYDEAEEEAIWSSEPHPSRKYDAKNPPGPHNYPMRGVAVALDGGNYCECPDAMCWNSRPTNTDTKAQRISHNLG
jgi:hypothetical protein